MNVDVYKNLHKSRAAGRPVYSVRDRATGKVVQHSDHVSVANATFVVSEAGRQRVIREGRKNVHAFVRGRLVDNRFRSGEGTLVRYNPYQGPTFVSAATGEPVTGAGLVVLNDRVTAWYTN